MKNKITAIAPAIVLTVAIAVTALANNNFGSAKMLPLPVQGDPVPGVDVSIEQSPGGIMTGQTPTNQDGVSEFSLKEGKYLLLVDPFVSKIFRKNLSEKKPILNVIIKIGQKVFFETWDGSRRCLYTKFIDVPRGPAQAVEVTVQEGKPCESVSGIHQSLIERLEISGNKRRNQQILRPERG